MRPALGTGIGLTALAAFAFLSIAIKDASTGTVIAGDLSLSMDLLDTSVMLGGPVRLRMSLRNNTRLPLVVLFNYINPDPYHIKFTVEEGPAVANRDRVLPLNYGLELVRVKPGATYQTVLCLNRYVAFREPCIANISYDVVIWYYPKNGRPVAANRKTVAARGVLTVKLLKTDREALKRELASLTEGLKAPSAQTQFETAEALCHLDDPVCLEFVAKVLAHHHSNCQVRAVKALRRFGTEKAINIMVGALRPDQSPRVVGGILEGLLERRHVIDSRTIQALLGARHSGIRLPTVKYLCGLGSVEHLPLVRPLVDDWNPAVASWAKKCIEKLEGGQ